MLWRLRCKLILRAMAEMFLTLGYIFSYEAECDWEAKLTPALAENLSRRRKGKVGPSCCVDETYIREPPGPSSVNMCDTRRADIQQQT